jgi:GGDEF domain-containing protein
MDNPEYLRDRVSGVLSNTDATSYERARALDDLDKLYRAAVTDGLTGLPNRQSFLRNLEADAKEYVGSVAILDIDNFKHVNDMWGHDTGDKVLRRFARVLERHTRHKRDDGKYDFLGRLRRRGNHTGSGRLGGEEFGAYMRDTDTETARRVLERVQDDLTGHAERYLAIFEKHVKRKYGRGLNEGEKSAVDYIRKISFSAGIAPIEDSDIMGSVKHADEALYKAKEAGRHRVYVWSG